MPSLPGVAHLSIDRAVRAARKPPPSASPASPSSRIAADADKNPGHRAWNPDNLVCRATRAIKAAVPEIGVLLNVALDPYNSDGHDGLVRDGVILNDETLEALAEDDPLPGRGRL